MAGPSPLEELREELAITSREPRATRAKLERFGAVVARSVVLADPHRHTSELARWDQRFDRSDSRMGLRAARGRRPGGSVAPQAELHTWFSWRLVAAMVDSLVASRRLERIDGGLIAAP